MLSRRSGMAVPLDVGLPFAAQANQSESRVHGHAFVRGFKRPTAATCRSCACITLAPRSVRSGVPHLSSCKEGSHIRSSVEISLFYRVWGSWRSPSVSFAIERLCHGLGASTLSPRFRIPT
jgi:hypothetical protein